MAMGWPSQVGAAFAGVSRDIATYHELTTPGTRSGFTYLFAQSTKVTTPAPVIELVTTNESGTVISAEKITLTGTDRRVSANNSAGDFISIRVLVNLANLKADGTTGGTKRKFLVGLVSLDGATSVKVFQLPFSQPTAGR